MNKTFLEKIAARLAAQNIFFHMLIGVFAACFLCRYRIIATDEDFKMIIAVTSLPFMFVLLFGAKCCKIFYGETKYSTFFKGGKNIGVPVSDLDFINQMHSPITAKQKRAGLIYPFTKFVTCFYLGLMLTSDAFLKLFNQ